MNKISIIFNKNLYLFSLFFRQAAGTVVLLVIARYLSVYNYGLFSGYKNIAAFCLIFTNFDFGDYILVSSKSNVRKVRLKISLFLLNAVNVIFLIFLFSLFFKMDSHFLFWLVVLRTFFDVFFFSLILPYFQAAHKFNQIASVNIVYSVGIFLIAVISYIFKFSLSKFLILNIILGILNFIQCSYLAKLKYSIILFKLKKSLKYIDKSIIPYIYVCSSVLLYAQIQPLFVSVFMSKEDCALYFSANTIASILGLLLSAQRQKLLPELINKNVQYIKMILIKNTKSIFLNIGLIFIFFVFFGKLLLTLFFGKEFYSNSYYILLLLTASHFFLAIISIYGAYITSSGNQSKKFKMQFVAIIIALLSLFTLKHLGIYGAAYSYLITTGSLAALYYFYTNRLIKINLSYQENL